MKPATNLNRTILLIDDDEDDCLFLSQALAAITNSITLHCTQSADHLLESIDCNKPCLIFIDFYLPKKGGLDLLRRIKNHPGYKDIPIVMWSTSYMHSNVTAAMYEGAFTFLEKPCCYTDLVVELKSILLQNYIDVQHT
jgi:DNA-binding NtrC family response regulator